MEMNNQKSVSAVWKQYQDMSRGKAFLEKYVILIFGAVAAALLWSARKVNLTYNEINVLVYYWAIPATWTLLLDYKMGCGISISSYSGFFPVLTAALCFAWIGIIIATFRFFRSWCNFVFKASQDFLCVFNRWGGNYILNSVVICVLLPVLFYVFLFLL